MSSGYDADIASNLADIVERLEKAAGEVVRVGNLVFNPAQCFIRLDQQDLDGKPCVKIHSPSVPGDYFTLYKDEAQALTEYVQANSRDLVAELGQRRYRAKWQEAWNEFAKQYWKTPGARDEDGVQVEAFRDRLNHYYWYMDEFDGQGQLPGPESFAKFAEFEAKEKAKLCPNCKHALHLPIDECGVRDCPCDRRAGV